LTSVNDSVAKGGVDVNDEELRREAVAAIKRRREFQRHVVTYVWVNTVLVAIWVLTGAGFFWPIFSIAGWGIGVAAHAWDTYGPSNRISEAEIQREVRRLRGV
jgi:hypothetical protein